MTTKNEIKTWFIDGKNKHIYTHMIIVCDTFDYEDYPVYVKSNEDIQEVMKTYDGTNMQKIMEIYKFNLDMDMQLEQRRAFNI